MRPSLSHVARAAETLACASVAVALAACGRQEADAAVHGSGEISNVVVTHPALPPLPGQDACTVETGDYDPPSADHVPTCTPLLYPTRPPAGGKHYPYWAAYRTYDAPVSPGFLVHDEEHGGVVLAYACAGGCPEVVAALQSLVDAFPADPSCASPPRARLVLAPDPTLDVPIGAAAWGHFYRATCLDRAGLAAWVAAHYGQGPEATCADGVDLAGPEGGVADPCTSDAGRLDAPPDAPGDATTEPSTADVSAD